MVPITGLAPGTYSYSYAVSVGGVNKLPAGGSFTIIAGNTDTVTVSPAQVAPIIVPRAEEAAPEAIEITHVELPEDEATGEAAEVSGTPIIETDTDELVQPEEPEDISRDAEGLSAM